jgi:hypothetical protein
VHFTADGRYRDGRQQPSSDGEDEEEEEEEDIETDMARSASRVAARSQGATKRSKSSVRRPLTPSHSSAATSVLTSANASATSTSSPLQMQSQSLSSRRYAHGSSVSYSPDPDDALDLDADEGEGEEDDDELDVDMGSSHDSSASIEGTKVDWQEYGIQCGDIAKGSVFTRTDESLTSSPKADQSLADLLVGLGGTL